MTTLINLKDKHQTNRRDFVRQTIALIRRSLEEGIPVFIGCLDDDHRSRVKELLKKNEVQLSHMLKVGLAIFQENYTANHFCISFNDL